MANDFLNIDYAEWLEYVSAFFETPKKVLDKHFQTYPFAKMTDDEKSTILSEAFFTYYVKSCAFLAIETAFVRTVDTKKNGSLRETTIVPPITFLVLIALGGHLYTNQISSTRSERFYNRFVYYAGSYDKKDFTYKKSYEEFTLTVKETGYPFFLKTDLTNFYPSINMNLLATRISKFCPEETPKSLMFYQQMLEFLGNGRFPTIPDNTGLSYIATGLFLREFDNEIIEKLELQQPVISRFELIRYVDDLYILFDCKEEDKARCEELLNQIIQDAAFSSQLTINTSKQRVAKTKELDKELSVNLYEYFVKEEDLKLSDYYGKDQLKNLLEGLSKIGDYPSHNKVECVMEKHLVNGELAINYLEVLNWFVYSEKKLFNDSDIVQLVDSLPLSVLRHYPKQLTQMILNTGNRSVISNFLKKLQTECSEEYVSKYYEIMIFQYLMGNGFKDASLLELLKNTNSSFERYYKNYLLKMINYQLIGDNIPQLGTIKLQQIQDEKLFYLEIMAKYNHRQGQILQEFAYYKNYFDRRIAYCFALLGIKEAISKQGVNVKAFFKGNNVERILREVAGNQNIKEIDERLIKKVRNAFKLRNKNPSVHASSELLDYENLKKDEISLAIDTLKEVISILSNYINNNTNSVIEVTNEKKGMLTK